MANPNIICKLTGIKGPGIKAHIIPRGFYSLKGSEGTFIIRPKELGHTSHIPNGIYDTGIVTQEGEDYFREWDDHAYKCLVGREFPETLVENNGQAWYSEIPRGEYAKLKLFFISLLWRAGVSNQDFFSDVSLGPHEPRLRRMILDNNPGGSQDYSVIMWRHADTPSCGHPMHHPQIFRCKADNIRYYKWSIGHLEFWIKVDQRPHHWAWDEVALNPAYPTRIMLKEPFRESKMHGKVQAELINPSNTKLRRALERGSFK